MTGYRIGILQLQCIEILVLPDSLIPLLLCSNVRVIFIYSLIQHVGLLICKRSALRLKRIKDHLRRDLLIVIIRKGNERLSEMQTVSLLELGNLLQFSDIAVGYIIHLLDVLHKLITVLHDHKLIVTHKPLLLELHSGTYAEIVLDGTFV